MLSVINMQRIIYTITASFILATLLCSCDKKPIETPVNPFKATVISSMYDLYPGEPQKVSFRVAHAKGDLKISLSDNDVALTSYEFDNGTSAGTLVLEETTNDDIKKDITIEVSDSEGNTDRITITVVLHKGNEVFTLLDGTAGRSYELPEYERIMYIELNDGFRGLTADVEESAQPWIQTSLYDANNGLYLRILPYDGEGYRETSIILRANAPKETIKIDIRQYGAKSEKSFRHGLESLYSSTNGNSWDNHKNWLSDRPYWEWYGITVNTVYVGNDIKARFNGTPSKVIYGNDELWSLKLRSNNLDGEIAEDFWKIMYLVEAINIIRNPFSCENVPDYIWHENLREFSVWSDIDSYGKTALSVKGEINGNILKAKNLEILDIYQSDFYGNIPEEFTTTLTKLRVLDLARTKIHDADFFSTIGNLRNLEDLNLAGIPTSGIAFPEGIGNLTELKYLHIDHMNLTGKVPKSIGNCQKLYSLCFNDNDIEGPLPEEIGTIKAIGFINPQNNRIEHVPEFYRYVATYNGGWGDNVGEHMYSSMAKAEGNLKWDVPWFYSLMPGWYAYRYDVTEWRFSELSPKYPYAQDLQYPADEYYYDGEHWRHPRYEYPAIEYWYDGKHWVHEPGNPWSKDFDTHQNDRCVY